METMSHSNLVKTITSQIIDLQDENGCWNVLNENDKGYPELKHYSPIYSTTLWTLILLADIGCPPQEKKILKPLETIKEHFFDRDHKIFTIGKSHFPIPCLNGNMIYLLQYFQHGNMELLNGVIDFFAAYQRFDDGDYNTPKEFPYYSNRSCYGKHTCYWGVVKLFKGLSFILPQKRSKNATILIGNCIDFILEHEVCYSSHHKSNFLHTNIKKLTFPNMYQADYLEILWLLKREGVVDVKLKRALEFLRSSMKPDSTWQIERPIKNLIIPFKKSHANEFITQRATEVLNFYAP